MNELEFLKSKGLIKEGYTDFVISGEFGKISLNELLKEYKGLKKTTLMCIESEYNDLTVGYEYELLEEYDKLYKVKNNDSEEFCYLKSYFKKLKN